MRLALFPAPAKGFPRNLPLYITPLSLSLSLSLSVFLVKHAEEIKTPYIYINWDTAYYYNYYPEEIIRHPYILLRRRAMGDTCIYLQNTTGAVAFTNTTHSINFVA
jgi:hypothetical protein